MVQTICRTPGGQSPCSSPLRRTRDQIEGLGGLFFDSLHHSTLPHPLLATAPPEGPPHHCLLKEPKHRRSTTAEVATAAAATPPSLPLRSLSPSVPFPDQPLTRSPFFVPRSHPDAGRRGSSDRDRRDIATGALDFPSTCDSARQLPRTSATDPRCRRHLQEPLGDSLLHLAVPGAAAPPDGGHCRCDILRPLDLDPTAPYPFSV